MLRRLSVGLFALLAFGGLSAANAQRGGEVEVVLGEETALKIIPETDKINTTQIPGRFKGIRVYVTNGSSVNISKIDIKYSDGSEFVEDRGRPIQLTPREPRTRLIGPNDGERFIDSIVLHYRTTGDSTQRARVKVTGVTSAAGARALRDGATAARPNISGAPGVPPMAAPPLPTAPATAVAAAATPSTPNKSAPGTLTAGGDVLFGVQSVGFLVDRDVIKVGSEFGKFDKIRLRVLDNEIFLNELRVIYSNGEPDVLAHAANVPVNSRTKWFDLKGDRFIKEIQLVYKSRPGFRGQARVEAYGEYAEGWYGRGPATPVAAGQAIQPTGEAFQHGANRGWLYLGGQQPKFFSVKKGLGYQNDVVAVARNWGFNRLRIDVKERAITLNRLTIAYADGTSDVVPVAAPVEGGSSYGPVTLKPKPVKEIQVSYRSRFIDSSATGKGYAFVEFWVQ